MKRRLKIVGGGVFLTHSKMMCFCMHIMIDVDIMKKKSF